MNFEKMLFRCSSLCHIMTEPRSKSETISETCKTHLIEKFVLEKYGRSPDIWNRYIEKGLRVEEDSITLYSRFTKTFFKKNELQIKNEFISGTPDLFTGESVMAASKIIDIKSSWDIFTFFKNANPDKLNKNYYWQLQGYMALTRAKDSELAYCLTNTPEDLIQDEKRKLSYRIGGDPEFAKACAEIDRLSIYDDIPITERVITIDLPRNEEAIEKIYEKVVKC